MSLRQLSARELRDSIRSRDLSSVEVTAAFLAAIDRVDETLNAFTAAYPEEALAAAGIIDAQLGRGEERLLSGVPYALKDLTDTADFPTTYGSGAFRDHRPARDAQVAVRLREAGGVFLGKTNTPEFGGRPTTAFGFYGATRNPWNAELTAGGSSGGSAAAVAAGLCPLAEGSDSGGSVRIPASCCGVVGLKPSRGRVSSTPRLALNGGLFTHGPLARTVADSGLMLDAICGHAPGDAFRAEPPRGSFLSATLEAPPGGRVAVITGAEDLVDPQVSATVSAIGDLLAELGHHVEATGPDLGGLEDSVRVIEEANFATIDRPPEEFTDPYSRLCHERGGRITASEYLAAIRAMESRSAEIVSFFDEWDFLLTPTVTLLPQPVEDFGATTGEAADEDLDYTRYLYPFNMTGQPAISLPAGWSREGLPIGIQIVGRCAEDRGLISIAAQLEDARPWAERRPDLTPSPSLRRR